MTPPDLPAMFYLFVNLLNPMAAHNAMVVGSFTSGAWSSASMDSAFAEDYVNGTVDYLPFVVNPNLGPKVMSAYQLGATADYIVEYNAELARRQSFPLLPPRLSCTYAFGPSMMSRLIGSRYAPGPQGVLSQP
jgi:hypothetical protein